VNAASANELMTLALARRLQNGEVAMTGASSIVPVAACLLAQQLHAPDLTLIMPSGVVNPAPGRLFQSASDGRWADRAEAIGTAYDLFEVSENGRLDVMFYGGVQIDRRGNINLTQVGGSTGVPSFRGPGLANISFAVTCKRILLYSPHHNRRTFVDRVDYLTAPGHLDGGDSRRRAGITTPGPEACITPLAVMDFTGPDHSMRVRHLQPGVTGEQVVGATGFDLGSTDDWTQLPPPGQEELDALRSEVDRTGALRGGANAVASHRRVGETVR
jgi:glutaconate CoA-transferase subunit B